MEPEKILNLESILKIDNIGEFFKESLQESYPLYVDNCKKHRQKAATLKEDRKRKRGFEKKIKFK